MEEPIQINSDNVHNDFGNCLLMLRFKDQYYFLTLNGSGFYNWLKLGAPEQPEILADEIGHGGWFADTTAALKAAVEISTAPSLVAFKDFNQFVDTAKIAGRQA